jgi:hypothetical protein
VSTSPPSAFGTMWCGSCPQLAKVWSASMLGGRPWRADVHPSI